MESFLAGFNKSMLGVFDKIVLNIFKFMGYATEMGEFQDLVL